ncbi:MAG: FtsH protease activity modulator HflK [Acidobacteriota bacterium]
MAPEESAPRPLPPGDDPPSVRWILAALEGLRRHRRRLLPAIVVVALAVWLMQGLYSVGNGESAVVLRWGRAAGPPVASGLHFRLAGIDRVVKVATGDVFRLELTGEKVPQLALITGDENLIETTLVVQYQVSDPERFLFASEDPAVLVEQTTRAALVEVVAGLDVDTVLTSGKAAIQNRVRSGAQQLLEAYRVGVQLTAVNLQSVDPPREAAVAFRDVNDAKALAARRVSDAEGEAERALSLARGQGEKLQREAAAEADRRVQQARGASARFRQVLAQKRLTPGQTRTDLWLETIREVLPRTRIVVLAPGQKPEIDLQLLEDGVQGLPRRSN